LHLFTQERKNDLAVVILHLRIGHGLVLAAVPNSHFAGAVCPLGKLALELKIRKAVIGHRDRQPLIVRVHRRPFWYRPRLSRSADLEPQIKMQPPRMMLMDNKPPHNRPRRRNRIPRNIQHSLHAANCISRSNLNCVRFNSIP